MLLSQWYWIILAVWVIFGGIGFYRNDPRFTFAGNLVLLVLLIILGFLTAGHPVK